jgi:spermidine/putrescine transport system substrate-binding protein
VGLTILLAVLWAGCGQPQETLRVFVWSEYLDPEIVAGFEKEFRCRVTVDLYEDPDSMVAKLAAGGAGLYDIVVPSDTTLPGLVQRGLLAPLRPQNIPNLQHLEEQFRDPPYDPGSRYSVACQWGTVGILVRTNGLKTLDATWGLFFDPARQPGPFLLLEDVRACLGAALAYQGHSLNSINPVELAQARDLLIQVKGRSLGFEGGAGSKNRVLSGGAVAAMTYNGDGFRAMKEDPETVFLVPREGTQIWVDVLSIPAQAPNRALAEKFIDYLLDPRVGAQFSTFNQLATPNRAARVFISPKDLNNVAMYPPPEVIKRLEYSRDLGAQNQLYDEAWTQVKAK